MNRLAVALAADSAVTITGGQETKIYQSENKLFELSETKPVGLMIYNSTHFFGIPWEIIIKDFRKKHGSLETDMVFGWVPVFTKFLTDNFKPTKEQQNDFVAQLLWDAFDEVHRKFAEEAISIALDDTGEGDEGRQKKGPSIPSKISSGLR